MAALPMELITEILDRLPVRSLIRFRCVSKWWRSFIDSPRFVRRHLCRAVECGTNLSLILWTSSSLYWIDVGSVRRVEETNHPLRGDGNRITVLGSCNGLLCISNEADRVVIWNPSTGKYKFLPRAQVRRALGFLYYGFGYDDRNDDYVLLRLYHLETEPMGSEVRIYSLKNNAWKRLHDIPYFLYYVHKMGVFTCCCLHWIMTREMVSDSVKMLVAYDLGIEDLRVVDLPDVIDDKLDINIAVLGGCLCLSVNNNHMGVDVWIMKEYGLKESWANLFSIPQSEVATPLGFVRPLAHSHDVRKILVRLDDKNLAWYDLETKCIDKVDISGMPSSFEAEICFTTLVSVDDAARIRRERENRNMRDDFLSMRSNLVL